MYFNQYVENDTLKVPHYVSTSEHISKLVSFLQSNTKITGLELCDRKIGDEGAKALAKLSNLTELNLGWNKIGDKGAEALVNGNLSSLILLGLQCNDVGDKGAIALAESPFKISLIENPIGDKGMKALAESEKYFELESSYNALNCVNGNSSLGFYKCLKELWSQARIWPKSSVNKLGEDTTKSLFFHLARQNHPKERIELLLDDSDKYPFLINSIDGQGHTLSHFYTHSPEMQKFLFERGMIPEQERSQERNQRRDDECIARDSQSVHASPIVKRTNFLLKS